VPGSDVEIMSFAVQVATVPPESDEWPLPGAVAPFSPEATPMRRLWVRDTTTAEVSPWPVYDRGALAPGARIAGPAIVAEDETSTLVGPGWTATIKGLGAIELVREGT
jgi:N-methylhydantoinase A